MKSRFILYALLAAQVLSFLVHFARFYESFGSNLQAVLRETYILFVVCLLNFLQTRINPSEVQKLKDMKILAIVATAFAVIFILVSLVFLIYTIYKICIKKRFQKKTNPPEEAKEENKE